MNFSLMFTSYEGVNPPKNYYTNQISFPDPPDLNSETSSENSTTSSSSSFDGVVSPYESAYSISNDPIIDTDRDLDSDTPTQQGSTKAHKSTAESIVDLARTYVGTPYNYAHETPEEGFDCSGLIKYAFGLFGIKLPRTSHQMGKIGKAVKLEDAKPGDIIYESSGPPSGGHVRLVSQVVDGHIYCIEAIGKDKGILERELTSTSRIKSIRRVIDDSTQITQLKTFSNPKDFTKTLTEAYRKGLQEKGLDPNYATMLVAQDAIETNWGKSVKGDYNYGNLTTTGTDWHNRTGDRKWRDFNSIEDYVLGKIDFLSKDRYKFFSTFTANSNISTAMLTLANRGYEPFNKLYGLSVARTYNNVLKYLNAE